MISFFKGARKGQMGPPLQIHLYEHLQKISQKIYGSCTAQFSVKVLFKYACIN